MKIRIANCGNNDLIVQSSGRGTVSLNPLSFGAKLARDYVEVELGANEVLILRQRGAKDPEGVEIKTPV